MCLKLPIALILCASNYIAGHLPLLEPPSLAWKLQLIDCYFLSGLRCYLFLTLIVVYFLLPLLPPCPLSWPSLNPFTSLHLIWPPVPQIPFNLHHLSYPLYSTSLKFLVTFFFIPITASSGEMLWQYQKLGDNSRGEVTSNCQDNDIIRRGGHRTDAKVSQTWD